MDIADVERSTKEEGARLAPPRIDVPGPNLAPRMLSVFYNLLKLVQDKSTDSVF